MCIRDRFIDRIIIIAAEELPFSSQLFQIVFTGNKAFILCDHLKQHGIYFTVVVTVVTVIIRITDDIILIKEVIEPYIRAVKQKLGSGLLSLKPVSYTHLDVYKRQGWIIP